MHALLLTGAFAVLVADAASAAFMTRMVVLDPSGIDQEINTATEALNILDGTFTPGTYVFSEDVSAVYSAINMGPGGSFGADTPYPNGESTIALQDFAVRATATVTIPVGTWTIGFGSDDGGRLQLPGVTFSNEFDTNGDSGLDDSIWFDSPRGFAWTIATFTVASETTTTLDALFFERAGGDAFEIAIAQNALAGFNATDFTTLSHGQLGWSVVPEPSTALLLLAGMAGLAGWRRGTARRR